jgi:beta-glucosidase
MHNEYFDSGDRKQLYLPKTQMNLAEAVCDVCENVIVVVLAGSAVDLGEKLTSHAKAIIHGWYPGSMGGLAIANIIAGKASPCGKLPVTMFRGDHDIPDFEDYNMKGRTYRFIEGEAQYPFGFGLSYTEFGYENAKVLSADEKTVKLSVEITNKGAIDGIEKAQVYAKYTDSRTVTPNFQLCAIKSVKIAAGEKAEIEFEIDRYWLKAVIEDGSRVDPDGKIVFYIGGHQPDSLSDRLTGYSCLRIEL